jgi:hypothetical protein
MSSASVGARSSKTVPLVVSIPAAHFAPLPAPAPRKRATVDEAVTAYLRFIASENAPLHIANKVSVLRRFTVPTGRSGRWSH